MDTYVFGYGSAIEVMRRGGTRLLAKRRCEIDLAEVTSNFHGLMGSGWLEWFERAPIEVLVARDEDARASQYVRAHVWGKRCRYWPVIQLSDSEYVSSPEFVFLQEANRLEGIDLVFLGCELCGEYWYHDGRIERRARLTSKERIQTFLDQHPGTRGRAKALAALKYVVDGAASPMEIRLALLLALPVKKGGWGIGAPELNRPIMLGPEAAKVLGRDYITPDLVWMGAKVVIEYDSDSVHTGSEHIAHDARRRLALKMEGYTVITVTNDQMRRSSDVEGVAKVVARATGKRLTKVSPGVFESRSRLAYRLRRLSTHPEYCFEG